MRRKTKSTRSLTLMTLKPSKESRNARRADSWSMHIPLCQNAGAIDDDVRFVDERGAILAVLQRNMPQPFQIVPFSFHHFGVQHHKWCQVVLLVESHKVLLNLWCRCVELTPVDEISKPFYREDTASEDDSPLWIRLEWKSVSVSWYVAGATRISVFPPK